LGVAIAIVESTVPLPIAQDILPTQVPVIDLHSMYDGPDARRELGRQIAQACADLGFFYIANHGIDEQDLDGLFADAETFFALDEVDKMGVALSSATNYRGYLPLKVMSQKPKWSAPDDETKGNLYEAFQIHREHAPDDPDVLSGKPLHGSNQWPAAMPGLRAHMLQYYVKMSAFALDMLQLFALGLDLPSDRFDEFFVEPMMQLRFIHYPPQPPGDAGDNLGLRPHTDSGAFTMLAQDAVGGLEILNRDGEWIRVPPIPGTYVVNLGEMMKVWSGGVLLATPHRVVNRSGRERYSIPFFATPDFDAPFKAIVENPDANAGPVFMSSVSADQGITCGQHLVSLYERIWPAPVLAR
jgi:isopenicillin N synthase-like dioxygenase